MAAGLKHAVATIHWGTSRQRAPNSSASIAGGRAHPAAAEYRLGRQRATRLRPRPRSRGRASLRVSALRSTGAAAWADTPLIHPPSSPSLGSAMSSALAALGGSASCGATGCPATALVARAGRLLHVPFPSPLAFQEPPFLLPLAAGTYYLSVTLEPAGTPIGDVKRHPISIVGPKITAPPNPPIDDSGTNTDSELN